MKLFRIFLALALVSGCVSSNQAPAPANNTIIQAPQEPSGLSRQQVPSSTNVTCAWTAVTNPAGWRGSITLLGYRILQGTAPRTYSTTGFTAQASCVVTLSTQATNYLAVAAVNRVVAWQVATQQWGTNDNAGAPGPELRILPSYWIPAKGNVNKLPTAGSTAQ